MAVVRNALREAELNLRFSYVPANDAHLFYVPNLDPDCLKVFRKAHVSVHSEDTDVVLSQSSNTCWTSVSWCFSRKKMKYMPAAVLLL